MFARAFRSVVKNRLYVMDLGQDLCYLLQRLMVRSRGVVVVMVVMRVSCNVMVVMD